MADMTNKKTYVLVGTGNRALYSYGKPMTGGYKDSTEILGVFDKNPLRIEAFKGMAGLSCPSYTDLDKMLNELRPDRAIISTIDKTHDEFAIKCMEAGVDVIIEKPMAIDAAKCKALLDAEKRTGRRILVTFNFRYTPYVSAIKQLIRDGLIGDVLNVDFEYLLDTAHGSDYFRRWHRRKENSGGLLVHKSTHHFDLVNWWIEEEPAEVMAFGTRRFYGPVREQRGERCSICDHKKTCEFFFDISRDGVFPYKTLFKDCEDADGYYRDSCPFSEEIDIEDTMSVNVRYSEGALLSYSLIAHSPYEAWRATISGTKGRIEAFNMVKEVSEASFDVFDRKGQKITYTLPAETGEHGGADKRLVSDIFEDNPYDPLNHRAGSFAGALSALIGIAANKSIAEHRSVKIGDLVPLDLYRTRGGESFLR